MFFKFLRGKKDAITKVASTERGRIGEVDGVKLGRVVLKAGKDVKQGEVTSIDELFSLDEQRRKFEVFENVSRDENRINVNVEKLGAFETIADSTVRKGKKADCFMLLKRNEGLSKKIVASQNVKSGDRLEVTFTILSTDTE